jgi:cell division protein ZapE
MTASFADQYHALVESGAIEADPAQAALVHAYTELDDRLSTHRLARKGSSLGWLFGRSEKKQPPLRGLYVHGEVGRGKTMLMDLFFQASAVVRKRRAHFHEFMADVHERVHGFRQKIARGEISETDPVRLTAATIFDESWLLCFDDIADAMILGRLFGRLFELGTVVVATSNVAPDDLYQGGLNRALFVPFIGQLKAHMEVVRLDARTDFRMEKLSGVRMWHVPADLAADRALDEAWARLIAGAPEAPHDLAMKGRVLAVPRAGQGAARFSFAELCDRPLGASDYLRLAHEFHTLVIDRIPVMTFVERNQAKRFITLIDALYDNAVKLVASAAVPPADLYQATEGIEVHEFKRTASRLFEMGAHDYLALPHGRRDSTASDSTEGLVET